MVVVGVVMVGWVDDEEDDDKEKVDKTKGEDNSSSDEEEEEDKEGGEEERGLIRVNLANNAIGDKGAAALADALKVDLWIQGILLIHHITIK